VAGHSLKPAKDRRLGEPLPHQLANPTRAHLLAINLSLLRGLYGITSSFPELFRTIRKVPTRYSPVCRSHCCALDLHVLGLPPAFVLSQDQTLRLKVFEPGFGLEEVTHPAPSLRQAPDQSLRITTLRRSDLSTKDLATKDLATLKRVFTSAPTHCMITHTANRTNVQS
jgi:hypothetical protein